MLDTIPSYELISDPFAVRSAVTALCDAFAEPTERPPRRTRPFDRRKFGRLSFEVPVRILGAVFEGGGVHVSRDEDNSLLARTRDISLSGIGLAHAAPLPGGKVVAFFSPPSGQPICLAVEVAWSQAAAKDSWHSGVRILGVLDAADPPVA